MNPLIVIVGPTASGKTKLAVELAHEIKGEIISADSRQVYQGMDIGTGKDRMEYWREGKEIPVHLLDIRQAGASYHVADFQKDFREAFLAIRQREKMPILCGGSGMYIEAVLRQFEFTAVPVDLHLRKELEGKPKEELMQLLAQSSSPYRHLADVSTKKRLIRALEIGEYLKDAPLEPLAALSMQAKVFGIHLEVEERWQRIKGRLGQRLDNGLVEEVKSLLDKGVSSEKLISYGLEYRFITQFLFGELSYAEMVEKLNIAIRQFAKRQMTYFRHMEQGGISIHWLDGRLDTQHLTETIRRAEWNQ